MSVYPPCVLIEDGGTLALTVDGGGPLDYLLEDGCGTPPPPPGAVYIPRRESQFYEAHGRVVGPVGSIFGRGSVTPPRYARGSVGGPVASVSGRGRVTRAALIRQRLLEDKMLSEGQLLN